MSSVIRAVWRWGRRLPVVGRIVRGGDRVWWYLAVVRSGLVDAEFYAAQRGWTHGGVRRAAWDYVGRGHREGVNPHAVIDELVLGRSLPEADRVPSLYAYLRSDGGVLRPHPWWDGEGGIDRLLDPADPRLCFRFGDDSWTLPLSEVRRRAITAVVARRTGTADTGAGMNASTSVIRVIGPGDRRYDEKLLALASLPADTEVVIVAGGAGAGQWAAIDLLVSSVPGLRAVAAPRTFADAVMAGARVATGSALVVLGARAALSSGDALSLADQAVAGRAVAPVQLAHDGTIESIGAARVGGRRPYRLLAGLPREDLGRLPAGPLEVPALAGETFAILSADLDSAGGLDARDGDDALTEFCLRRAAADASSASFVDPRIVATQFLPPYSRRPRGARPPSDADRPRATEILESAGFRVLGWQMSEPRPSPRLARPDDAPERWAIRISSPAGPAGEVWGDTHFARGLAAALRRTGREVVIDAYEARDRASAVLDDVTLVVRGPHRIRPPRTGTRLLWIISHPDEITRRELSWFDAVFAASRRWSAKAGAKFGADIRPLLECTDADQFFPRGLERGDDIVFVGTSRGIARPSVVAPLRAGVPVKVYGPDWRGFIPSSAIVASSIPNDRLSERYESAAVVLNDHWPAMRREGFMAMRPFDVVAAGGRVISEDVDGLEEVFGGAVVAYRDEEELVALLRSDLDSVFPDRVELQSIQERVRREHSFDARAEALADAARAVSVRRTRRVQPLH